MPINVGGLVSIIVFYLVILAVGLWAGWKHSRKSKKGEGTESVMLAGRSMGVFVGIMTMTGTVRDRLLLLCICNIITSICTIVSYVGGRRLRHGLGRNRLHEWNRVVSSSHRLRYSTHSR